MNTRIDYHFTSDTLSIDANIDLSRIVGNIAEAQYFLDSQVMTDMVPYMPKQTNTFINETISRSSAIAGTGTVVAAAPPMGRFLYMGKVMIGIDSRSPWARAGEKKIVTDRDLQFSKAANPKVQKQWFDAAKRAHSKDWVKQVKRIAGGKA